MSVMDSGEPPYSSEAYKAYTRWWKGNQEVKAAKIAAEEAAPAEDDADDLPAPITAPGPCGQGFSFV
jgi:hypothetical protein